MYEDEILTKDNLIKRLGDDYDYKIFRHFLNFDFKLRFLYPSPFRQDNDPSFNIFQHSRNDKLYFKDHGDEYNGDCFQLVQYLYSCSFKEALEIIASSFGLTFKELKVKQVDLPDYTKPLDFQNKEFVKIDIETQKWKLTDKNYWSQYEISSNRLKKFNVYSCNAFWINGYIGGFYEPDNPIYAYEVNNRFRIYRPYEKPKNKWRGNLTHNDIFGYNQLPDKGELCLITSSLKDVMVCDTLSFPAISGNSESANFTSKFISHLYSRFDNLLTYYNNDTKGLIFAKKIYEKHGISYIHNPFGTPKDPSDYVKEFSLKQTEIMLNKLIYGE